MSKNKNTIGILKYSKEIKEEMEERLEQSMTKLLFEMPFKQISISRLCQEANVSRMAYYAHFTDKMEILERLVIKLNKDLIASVGSPFIAIPDKTWYVRLFQYIYNKKEVFIHLFEAGFYEKYLNLLNEVIIKKENLTSLETIKRLVWNGGIVNAVKYWLMEKGASITIDEMADYCYKTFNW